jgi:hypothetical protein
MPPNTIFNVNFSDKKNTEDKTVTTGSKVDTSAAIDAPVLSIPLRKDQKARTVEIIAIKKTDAYPKLSTGGTNPVKMFIIPYANAVPNIINADD